MSVFKTVALSRIKNAHALVDRVAAKVSTSEAFPTYKDTFKRRKTS